MDSLVSGVLLGASVTLARPSYGAFQLHSGVGVSDVHGGKFQGERPLKWELHVCQSEESGIIYLGMTPHRNSLQSRFVRLQFGIPAPGGVPTSRKFRHGSLPSVEWSEHNRNAPLVPWKLRTAPCPRDLDALPPVRHVRLLRNRSRRVNSRHTRFRGASVRSPLRHFDFIALTFFFLPC